jgi:adenylate cyclase
LRDYEAAVSDARHCLQFYPDYPLGYRWLAMALGQTGRRDEARQALQKAITIAPKLLDVYNTQHRLPWYRSEDWEHALEGMRKAGWDG